MLTNNYDPLVLRKFSVEEQPFPWPALMKLLKMTWPTPRPMHILDHKVLEGSTDHLNISVLGEYTVLEALNDWHYAEGKDDTYCGGELTFLHIVDGRGSPLTVQMHKGDVVAFPSNERYACVMQPVTSGQHAVSAYSLEGVDV